MSGFEVLRATEPPPRMDVHVEYGVPGTVVTVLGVTLVWGTLASMLLTGSLPLELAWRVAALIFFSAIAALILRATLFEGRFVFAANGDGVIYRTRDKRDRFVRIPWLSIESCEGVTGEDMLPRGARLAPGSRRMMQGDEALLLRTRIAADAALPGAPANGQVATTEGAYVFSFATASADVRRLDHDMNQLRQQVEERS